MRKAALVVFVALVACSSASAKSSGTFSIPDLQVTAGAPVAYDYSGEHTKGLKVTLQRQFGHRYKDVKVLRHAGPGTAPGLPMGRYGYRLAFFRGHKFLAASKPVFVYSYGRVKLCATAWVAGCAPGSTSIGKNSFSYEAVERTHNGGAGGVPSLRAKHSTCRSGTVRYALAGQEPSTTTGYAEVDDSVIGKQTDYVQYGSVETFKFNLADTTWDLVFWESPADPPGTTGPAVYFAGSLSCWTPTGS